MLAVAPPAPSPAATRRRAVLIVALGLGLCAGAGGALQPPGATAGGEVSGPFELGLGDGPWWRSPLALGLAAMALVALGLTLGRLRAVALARRAARLEALVAERTAQLAEANRRLEEAAVTDPLTGARNRRFFDARIEEDAAVARRRVGRGEAEAHLALAMIDVDRFKAINDCWGHAVGDEVLRQIAERLRGLVRQGDFLVRWGGEEFLLVLRDVAPESLPAVARRVLAAVAAAPIATRAGDVPVRCSAGLVCFPLDDPAATVEEAVRRADEALYAAKQGGRFRAVVETPERQQVTVLADAEAAGASEPSAAAGEPLTG